MKLTDRTELRQELTREIKHQLRYNPRVKGNDSWKSFETKPNPYVHKPLWPILVTDKRETGRSEKYHAERVEEMIVRNELGMDLWGADEPADMEHFDEELTTKEMEFIGYFLRSKGDDTLSRKLTSNDRRLAIMREYNARKRSVS